MIPWRIADFIKTVIQETGYEKRAGKWRDLEGLSRLENIKGLYPAAREFENANEDAVLTEFLEEYCFGFRPWIIWKLMNSAVVLMTLHIKGLEFPVVFVVGLEEGLFPRPFCRKYGRAGRERGDYATLELSRA